MTTNSTIRYVELARQFDDERRDLLACIEGALSTGQWVGGSDVEALENELQAYSDAPHVVTLGSGTDALILALRALDIGVGDEVITPPNSFVSSTAAIIAVGATPVFVDVLDDQLLDPAAVQRAITPKTRAIMPVHLSGRCCDMVSLQSIAADYRLFLIEDAAQAFGARLHEKHAGTWGDVGCFSAHPLKNLNAAGDAGFVYCKDRDIAQRILRLRNNGLQDRNIVAEWGTVSRLDSVQAAILRYRLPRTDAIIEARRRNAQHYQSRFASSPVFAPMCQAEQFNAFHTFVIQVDRRDEVQRYLLEHDIQTSIHYPIPIHLQPAAVRLGYREGDFPAVERQASRILSLPIHQYLKPEEIDRVADTILEFLS